MKAAICVLAAAMIANAASAQSPSAAPPTPRKPVAPHAVAAFDTDGDGVVSRAEYLANAMKRFAHMDVDKNRMLTSAERNLERPPGSGMPLLDANKPPPPQPNGADVDGDGLISIEEYYFNIGRIFARYDLNGDGRITPDEIMPADAPGQPVR